MRNGEGGTVPSHNVQLETDAIMESSLIKKVGFIDTICSAVLGCHRAKLVA